MNVGELLADLTRRQVELWCEGDRLRYRAPEGSLTPDLRAAVAEYRSELIALLSARRGGRADQLTVVPDPFHRYDPFPLTDIQQAYWMGRNGAFELGNVACHSYSEFEFKGLDLARFNRAWQRLIERHDMLRMIVLPDGRQQICASVPRYEIAALDLRGQSEATLAAGLAAVRGEMSHQVLPADRWPLFDMRATRLDGDRLRLHLSFDLLICDIMSSRILLAEVLQLYADPETELPPLELSFRDYVLAAAGYEESEAYQRALEYWRKRLPDLPPPIELPLAQSPAAVTQPHFVRRTAHLAADTWDALKVRAARARLTPSEVLLTAFAEVLATWSKSQHFTLNLTFFNRLPVHPQVNQIVGDFTATILLEVNQVNVSFAAQAQRIHAQLWQDLECSQVSGVRVLRELVRSHSSQGMQAGVPVVFTSGLALGPLSKEVASFAGMGELIYGVSQTPQVWLDHQVLEQGGALVWNWDAVEELFPAGLLDDMFEAYLRLLRRLAEDETAWENPVALLPEWQLAERAAANDTTAPLPPGLLHDGFLAQAAARPEAPAVIWQDGQLTYGETAGLARQIGRRLRELGVRPNELVGVLMEKGWEQIVGVLGVLLSGGAYLPIDAGLPQERQHYLLNHGQVRVALTQPGLAERLAWPAGLQVLTIDRTGWQAGIPEPPLPPVQRPEDLAYVIFTSGSTGLPKGVMIDHRGALNTCVDINRRFGVTAADRVLGLSALNFDLSVYDIFGILAAGGAVVLPDPAGLRDPAHWLDLLVGAGVTLWDTVPALMEMLVEYAAGRGACLPDSLRLVLMSGDWIPVTLPERIRKLASPDIAIISLGGATEASIWSILYPIGAVETGWQSIPYGRPMVNQRFHVLNERREPCPVWTPGTLYIGGVGLAQGYWRDAAKTAASFITHPRSGERLYRTGDLGRYLPGGLIEFLGREDFQVKVRGHRIELGEIETALEAHPQVRAAVVTAVGELRGDKHLVAYIVPAGRRVTEPTGSRMVLPGSATTVAGQEAQSGNDGVLLDPLERLRFKLEHRGLRPAGAGRRLIDLACPVLDEAERSAYATRRTYRKFAGGPVPLETLGRLLAGLAPIQFEGVPLPKYRYGSAGGLYPVQTYIYAKPGGVKDLAAGTYYYRPVGHQLELITTGAAIERDHYALSNRAIFDGAAFAIFLLGQTDAIAPMYGALARDFCLLEAGLMVQLLEMTAPAWGLGLCQVGGLEFEPIRRFFDLDDRHIYLHGLLGGAIEFEQARPAALTVEAAELRDLLAFMEDQGAATAAGWLDEDALIDELKRHLWGKLPDYMVPATFVLLDTLPLTANGKVDRKALPMPDHVRQETHKRFEAPRTALEVRLAGLWRELLDVERVGIYDDFYDLGGNSLIIGKLATRLRSEFQADLPLRLLLEATTIEQMAHLLEVALQPETIRGAAAPALDLAAEGVLDPAIRLADTPSAELEAQPGRILLTGATGFLGSFLLRDLLRQTGAEVYCLVRAADMAEGHAKLQRKLAAQGLWEENAQARIIPVLGDLAQPRLGLVPQQFRHLAETVGAIYHSGALVNFAYPYAALRTANVLGTQEVLRLACAGRLKSLHYVSTTHIFFSQAFAGANVHEEDDLGTGFNLYDGYGQSKWVAEKLVWEARARGLATTIYRPGVITGDSQTGVANTDDFMHRIIKGCLELGLVPDIDTQVDLAPVDFVSGAIVALSQVRDCLGRAFHLINPHPLAWHDVVAWLRSAGYPLEMVPYEIWEAAMAGMAERTGDHSWSALTPLFSGRASAGSDTAIQRTRAVPHFDCQGLVAALAGTGITCPPVDGRLLQTYLTYLRGSGFFPVPSVEAGTNHDQYNANQSLDRTRPAY